MNETELPPKIQCYNNETIITACGDDEINQKQQKEKENYNLISSTIINDNNTSSSNDCGGGGNNNIIEIIEKQLEQTTLIENSSSPSSIHDSSIDLNSTSIRSSSDTTEIIDHHHHILNQKSIDIHQHQQQQQKQEQTSDSSIIDSESEDESFIILDDNTSTTTSTTATTTTTTSTTTPTIVYTPKPPISFIPKSPDIRYTVREFPKDITLPFSKLEQQWIEKINPSKRKQKKYIYKLARAGVPPRIRGYIWRLTSGAIELEKKNIGAYQYLLSQSSEEYEYKISKDISRTFPHNPLFSGEKGQMSLFNILKAYSVMDPEIGYTQGMSFIAAVLLSEMDELETFWVFTCIMKNYDLSMVYSNDLSLLRQYLYKEIGVTPVLFASEWVSTLFTYNFDIKISKRLLDVFFVEGRYYIHRMVLAILKIYQKQLLGFEFEGAVEFLKKVGFTCNPDLIIEESDSMSLSLDLIKQFETEFIDAPSDYF
eukprot:gene1559-1978_t